MNWLLSDLSIFSSFLYDVLDTENNIFYKLIEFISEVRIECKRDKMAKISVGVRTVYICESTISPIQSAVLNKEKTTTV